MPPTTLASGSWSAGCAPPPAVHLHSSARHRADRRTPAGTSQLPAVPPHHARNAVRVAHRALRQRQLGCATAALGRQVTRASVTRRSVAPRRRRLHATQRVSKWSCLSIAGGTAGVPGWACGHARQPRQTPSRGGKPGIDDAFPLLSLGAHSDGAPSSCSPMPRPPPSTSRIARAPIT